jgi:hypothetical protein
MRLVDRILSLLARCFPLRKILASYRRMKVVVAALGQEQPPLANYDPNFVDTAGPRGGSRSTFRPKHFGPYSTPKLNGIMSALEPPSVCVLLSSAALHCRLPRWALATGLARRVARQPQFEEGANSQPPSLYATI